MSSSAESSRAAGPTVEAFVKTYVSDDKPVRDSNDDTLGFEAYLDAVELFLLNLDTKTPLTMSVEGEWGTGKTSFLLQLKSRLEKADPPRPTVFFNAWRHDSNESLWAAFALVCIRDLRKFQRPVRKFLGDFGLLFARFDWRAAMPDLVTLALRLVALVFVLVITVMFLRAGSLKPAEAAASSGTEALILMVTGFGGIVGAAFVLFTVVKKAIELVGDPFEIKLRRYIAEPDYASRVAFIESFHEDFARVLKHYVGNDKLFIFIDDLDRCDVPRAAELMQAINMLTSSDVVGPVFVIGMDRRIVAASLAAKYESFLPYLDPSPPTSGAARVNSDSALNFGYAFMDKFVQLPFRVPRARHEYISRLLDHSGKPKSGTAEPDGQTDVPDDSDEVATSRNGPADASKTARRDGAGASASEGPVVDSYRVRQVILSAARLLDYNPRRVKQFINVFRLNAYIFWKTGRLRLTTISHDLMPGIGEMTIEKLGRFLAITLRWPRFVEALEDHPSMLSELQRLALKRSDRVNRFVPEAWRDDLILRDFLSDIRNAGFPEVEWSAEERAYIFSLEEVDVAALIDIAPSTRINLAKPRPAQVVEGPLDLKSPVDAVGVPSIISNSRTWHRGALELIVPLDRGGLAHFRLDRSAETPHWLHVAHLLPDKSMFDGAALFQSDYTKGNLELFAHRRNELLFFYHPARDDAQWTWPDDLNIFAPGSAVVIQSAIRENGNFELVAPRTKGGLSHYWRDNTQSDRQWGDPEPFAIERPGLEPIGLFETIEQDSKVSNLQVFAVDDQSIVSIHRMSYIWGQSKTLPNTPPVQRGRLPAVVRNDGPTPQGGPPEFAFFVPMERGVQHWTFVEHSAKWTAHGSFAKQLPVDAVAATVDGQGFNIVVRSGRSIYHIARDADGQTWTEPREITFGAGAGGEGAATET